MPTRLATLSRPARYAVVVADAAGQFSETSCTDFAHALSVAATMASTYPRKVTIVTNPDQVDVGCGDGLTEDERDTADATIAGAKIARGA